MNWKSRFNIEPIKFTKLFSSLRLPTTLTEGQLTSYKSLLRKRAHESELSPWPLVPNASRVLCSSNALYSPDVGIFASTLSAYSPESLLHDDFTELAQLLKKFHLNNQLTFDSFKFCAGVVNDRTATQADNIIHRHIANELYLCLRDTLIWDRDISGLDRWEELNEFRFVPCSLTRCPYTLSVPLETFIKPLPSVLRPNEVVISEFERVAWSQRALLEHQPTEHLLVGFKTFGVPTIDEVVSIYDFVRI